MSERGMCSVCRRLRPLDELLRVTERSRVWRERLVCRPSLTFGDCFSRGVGSAERERIELAVPTELVDVRVLAEAHHQQRVATVLARRDRFDSVVRSRGVR